jgi:hypothetical protein
MKLSILQSMKPFVLTRMRPAKCNRPTPESPSLTQFLFPTTFLCLPNTTTITTTARGSPRAMLLGCVCVRVCVCVWHVDWQVKAGTIFDNILVCDDPEFAKAEILKSTCN